MFLGIIDFGFDKFYPISFLGYVIIICYFTFIVKCRKKNIHGFEFTFFVFFIYFCFVLYILFGAKTSITYPNQLWFIPFLICVFVEGISYCLQHNKKLIIKRYKGAKQKIKYSIKKIIKVISDLIKKLIYF